MKSIIQKEYSKCFLCNSTVWLEEHHIFEASNRKLSEKYGLKVKLCHWCHNEPPNGVHHNKEKMLELKQIGQKVFMEYYNKTEDEFRQIFGRNYL